jgi:riboflavin biosynthesis pyrimidine reductase
MEGEKNMERPELVICTSASVDGRIAVSPDMLLLWGDERWQALGGSSDVFEQLKVIHGPQATLEGSGSFVREVDEPTPLPAYEGDAGVLYQDFLPGTVVRRSEHRGWFTVVDGRGRAREWIKDGGAFGPDWEGWHLLVLVAHHTPPEYLAYLRREEIPYLVAGQERVDLGRALEKLGAQLGVTTVVSTAGGKLNGALLRAGLVDEINIEFLPAVIGGFDTPSLFDSPVLQPDEWPTRLELISTQIQDEGRVWLRYRVISE